VDEHVTAEELWLWILDNAETVDGVRMCRQPIWGYLEARGVDEHRAKVRLDLVRELEAQGLVERPYPQSKRLIIPDRA
jgi:hypothetical protein